MTKKRFKEIVSTQKIVDTETGIEYDGLVDDELLDILNDQDDKIREQKMQLNLEFGRYNELHKKLYQKDFFEVDLAGEYTEDSRVFKNGLCVFNNRLGMAYSVTEIVEVLNNMSDTIDALQDELGKFKPLIFEDTDDNEKHILYSKSDTDDLFYDN